MGCFQFGCFERLGLIPLTVANHFENSYFFEYGRSGAIAPEIDFAFKIEVFKVSECLYESVYDMFI